MRFLSFFPLATDRPSNEKASKEDASKKNNSTSSSTSNANGVTKDGTGSGQAKKPELTNKNSKNGKKTDDDDDFNLDDFVSKDNDGDFFDDDDDIFGLGVGKKKESKNDAIPARRRRDVGKNDSSKNGEDVFGSKSQNGSAGDFLSGLSLRDKGSKNAAIPTEKRSKGKSTNHADWMDELGFGDEDDLSLVGGSVSEDKGDSSRRQVKSNNSLNGKLSTKEKDISNAKRNNNNNHRDGHSASSLGSGGERSKEVGGRKKTLDSNSEVSEIAESVEEYSFESEDDMTTDKTFSDPDNALKKLDYTETVGAVIYETL